MKLVRFSSHALINLTDRDIERGEVERTLIAPDAKEAGYDGRDVYMRRYHDKPLDQDMLLRVIVEETETEMVVITAYKTSQISRYLPGNKP